MKKTLIFISIFFFTSITFSQKISTDGLIAYYPFNGNVKDYSGNENHGKLWGPINSKDRFGKSDRAYHFNGYKNPSYIRVPNDPSLKLISSFSISCWVKVDDPEGINGYGAINKKGSHCVFAKDHDRNGIQLTIYFNNDSEEISWGSYRGGAIHIKTEIKPKTWYHFVIIHDQGDYKIFKDNTIIGMGTLNLDLTLTNEKDLYFGKFIDQWFPLNGDLDDIRIYDRVINEKEVSNLYHENGY
ncbi:MAG: hypothetical protein A2V66_14905 [Ignavibacteria bacterium RBG_13_36_8]|nr:MAG: hypothetical protein A2V66_14905 [Ignavibacteria bacterium RBG_13_36_8]